MPFPEDCLPRPLQLPETRITRVAAGLSGAGVYRVEAAGQVYALKVSEDTEPLEAWQRRRQIQELAAAAGLAPRVAHIELARRAVLSEFVADRGFAGFYWNPATRAAALGLLGQTLRRVHALPVPEGTEAQLPREVLAILWSGFDAGFARPAFVAQAVERLLAADAPGPEPAKVLSHNDINPTNLVYDGERLLLLDWDTAGLNDPFYDLAAISIFLRMDDDTCRQLLGAYAGGAPPAAVPARFVYHRRLASALCGTMFLLLAHKHGHPGATGQETLESTEPLGEFYARLTSGALSLSSAEGTWAFGLALLKASASL